MIVLFGPSDISRHKCRKWHRCSTPSHRSLTVPFSECTAAFICSSSCLQSCAVSIYNPSPRFFPVSVPSQDLIKRPLHYRIRLVICSLFPRGSSVSYHERAHTAITTHLYTEIRDRHCSPFVFTTEFLRGIGRPLSIQ